MNRRLLSFTSFPTVRLVVNLLRKAYCAITCRPTLPQSKIPVSWDLTLPLSSSSKGARACALIGHDTRSRAVVSNGLASASGTLRLSWHVRLSDTTPEVEL
jgi:hypothetical protein